MLRRDIFREYDIRGIAGEDLTSESVELIGRGIGTTMKLAGKRRVTVGRDCRPSSDELRDALAGGLNRSGISVIDIGVVPTPLLYFSIVHLKCDGGVMITGSHNPPEYNGFKTCVGMEAIHGGQIQGIYEMIRTGDFSQGNGDMVETDVLTPYRKYILENLEIPRQVRVALDCGNGTACLTAPGLISALGC